MLNPPPEIIKAAIIEDPEGGGLLTVLTEEGVVMKFGQGLEDGKEESGSMVRTKEGCEFRID